MQFLVIKKRSLVFILLIFLTIASASVWYYMNLNTLPVMNQPSQDQARVIHMVTGEFKSTTEDGKEIEAYRWDPGTILINKGEKVKLVIYGVNGKEHPFMIEGTNIKGTVKKGEETVVDLQFDQEGTYRLICLTHPDKNSSGPMIAYIVVD
ncbi:cupredoxin domain-containing protein [Bacillus sp. 31A1R]|uniref:Cupredoxin domain-containing protein n=1 Tax=Robertmurraya mangrovi TaxID=3098077 RepID=A0ABU5J512_9BACI|nr:cupredoxin domain-containing protein [Bacillus sp. 31A1R]MDZ5474509.1 cupredoxin domain-containing protein [Bacillus sp. 31A1R]